MSNQKPNSTREFLETKDTGKETIGFSSDGICSACAHARRKRTIDWESRYAELSKLCNRFRGDGSQYDVLVPGSGGKDSVYASALMRDEFGMTPLTVTWAPHIYTDWGRKNHDRWVASGFSNLLMTPNHKVHRLLTRLALENLFHPFQPFILGQMSGVPKLAKTLGIPLVVYGESNVEYGNDRSEGESSLKPSKYYTVDEQVGSDFKLAGMDLGTLTGAFAIPRAELDWYLPASAQDHARAGVEVHNLSYFVRWHPQECYYFAADYTGFEPSPERSAGTYSKYSSIDDKLDDLHYWTTFIKFGIGRATYDASQEIRAGDLSRAEGVSLVSRFDGEFSDRFLSDVLKYLSIPEREYGEVSSLFEQPNIDSTYLQNLANSFRSPHLWDSTSSGWNLRYRVDLL
jgi:N-acetyl sugar amidotransferase